MKIAMSRTRRDYIGYVFIAPSFLVYLVFVVIPVIMGLYYSFTNYNFSDSMNFMGLDNYIRLFQDQLFKKSIVNTVIYAVFTIIPQIVLGLLLAVALNGTLPGKSVFRSAIYLPNVTSMVAISMVWLWIYDPSLGILNRFLHFLGLPMAQWLNNPKLAMGCIIVMSIWKALGFNMIVYLAGLQSIPASLYEASTIDGATKWKQLLEITIPMLRPTTFFLLVTNCVNSFLVFEQVNIMTNGGPLDSTTTIVHQIYLKAFQQFQMGYAMAMAMILFIITVVITLLNFKYGNQGQDLDLD